MSGKNAGTATCRRASPTSRRNRVVWPMGIGAAEPERKGLTGTAFRQKLFELLELRPGRIARAAARLELTGAPALSHEADVIAGPLEQVGIHRKALRKKSVEIAPFGKAMDSLTGEERGTRRRARRRGGERVHEERAFAGDPIERRRRNGPIAIRAGMRERPVVGDGKENVRPRLRRLLRRRSTRHVRSDPGDSK